MGVKLSILAVQGFCLLGVEPLAPAKPTPVRVKRA
ncbi:hypothetical protein SAMN05444166_4296 [Singulisphaera sp. GP187]|nr:hypothetical protein SAMN05444166_4296 [Singulisphaera sp. GP187]